MRILRKARSLFKAFVAMGLFLILLPAVRAQETTGGLQGTIKDASGAVVAHAQVHVDTPSLPGGKTTTTDGKGYYRLANLPPGAYTITVTAKGFATSKQDGLILEVGRTPSIDVSLAVGSENTVVEVASENPAIDVTSVTTQTTVSKDVIDYVPRGVSYQSVIQFAPSARNEPLMGSTATNGTGSVSPGSGTNGNAYGYSVAGGSDSENSYLVEGQETANLIGGYSHTNVPFDFIQEVQVKSSGVEAEHGGALGGVVNVIMKKGSNRLHGSVFAQFEAQGLDAGPNPYTRYDPTAQPTGTNWGAIDQAVQSYQPVKAKSSDFLPGFTLGGPLGDLLPRMLSIPQKWDDRIFFFVGFNPQFQRYENKVNYGSGNGGVLPFSQNTNTYYSTARLDAKVTDKIRVFASWLYQGQRQNGESLPGADSTQGYENTSVNSAPDTYAHTLGFSAPNITFNTGADITLTSHMVATTRFGYYFENYHDNGYPRNGVVYQFQTSGLTADGATDAFGNPLPSTLQQGQGYQNGPLNQITSYNSNKAIQLDQDFAWFKSTPFGTHNFKFGYQLNRLSNYLLQGYNEPYVQLNVGNTSYSPQSGVGQTNCAAIEAADGTSACQGQYGYATVYDYGTGGKAISYNHSLFAQDSWTVGHGVTIDAGVRFEKEYLPGEAVGAGVPAQPIKFGWGDKIAPRLGAAWDVFRDGKIKLFGSYGVFYDQMKLNLAISSFGGQYWQNCIYALNNADPSTINVAFNAQGRDCVGSTSASPANFSTGAAPAGFQFIENINERASIVTCSTCNPYEEGVAPNLKPYRQHESVAGFDYQIARNVAFEARYDRRRLDHVIEDSSIFNPNVGETFVIVNPGQGVDDTFNHFCQFLYSTDPAPCVSSTGAYPPQQTIPAARSYDGLEFRVNKALSNHWFGMFSYTYSHFRGNYTGLTSSDISDGGNGGRNAPNNSRAFDEPYFSYNSYGGSSSGLLPTDRPNALKGYAYYQLNFLKRFTSNFGLFQTAYSGSPETAYIGGVGDVADYGFATQVFNRGKWANISQDPGTGVVTVGNPYTKRTPWYVQSDFNFTQIYKLTDRHQFGFTATFTNLFNQKAVTAVNEQIESNSAYLNQSQFFAVNGLNLYDSIPFYAAAEHAYNVTQGLNSNVGSLNAGGPQTISAEFGKPLYYQIPRKIRLQVSYSF